MSARLACLVATLVLIAGAACAKNTGVGDDSNLQSGPCYEALVDKNETHPTTAPKRELGAACQVEDGDIDKAWTRVNRLWGSDSEALPDYDAYRPANAPVDSATPRWVAAAGIVLTYLALGWPLRAAARLFGAARGPARGAVAGLAAALVGRGAICAAFGALFALPYVGALAAAAILLGTVLHLARPPATARADASAPSGITDALNDTLGALLSLAALGLFVQQNLYLFAFALLLALAVSTGPALALRRAARATPLRAALGAAALAAALGEALVSSPPVSLWLASLMGANLVAPWALAAAVGAAGWALAARRPARA